MDDLWTWDSVIGALGVRALAGRLEQSPGTVSGWRKRPRGIPPEHWRDVVEFAAEVGKSEITADVLTDVAARRASPCVEVGA
jgi:hypothetical protein